MMNFPVTGAGLGLRRGLLADVSDLSEDAIDFMEVAPENWIGIGGRFGRQFRDLTEKFPFVCHGLSLSLGSPAALDTGFVKDIKTFLDTHQIRFFTGHLSYCSDDKGHLYDLMPIPFTAEAVEYVARRIRTVQDILERPIAVEHVSYYAAPGRQMEEVDFINAVLEQADCGLLLDVNNIYVNSIKFNYDPYEFIARIDGERTVYVHTAGHYVEAPDLRVDTHGSAVIEPVWDLLDAAYRKFGVMPTLLERDFNFPPMSELLGEVEQIRQLQQRHEDA
jgi:uncharacterized protein (UPF0276 family)